MYTPVFAPPQLPPCFHQVLATCPLLHRPTTTCPFICGSAPNPRVQLSATPPLRLPQLSHASRLVDSIMAPTAHRCSVGRPALDSPRPTSHAVPQPNDRRFLAPARQLTSSSCTGTRVAVTLYTVSVSCIPQPFPAFRLPSTSQSINNVHHARTLITSMQPQIPLSAPHRLQRTLITSSSVTAPPPSLSSISRCLMAAFKNRMASRRAYRETKGAAWV